MALIDFHSEIERHADFFGRGDVMRVLEERLLDGPGPGGWVLASGGPGMGKSNILARFLKERSPDSPHHFLRRGYLDSNRPEVVVQSLVEQIVKKFSECFEDEDAPREHLQSVLQRVSDKILQPNERTLILIVDGLDEAEGAGGADNPLERIFPYYLPKNVRILCASRPLFPHLSFLRKQDRFFEIDLDAEKWSGSNIEAVQAFWAHHGPECKPPLSDAFIQEAVDKSEGNLLHAVKLREWLDELPEEQRRAVAVPRGLQGFIEEIWARLERLEDASFERLQDGLGLLCAAREALPLSALETCLQWKNAKWKTEFLRAARPFLLEIPKHWDNGGEDAYRPYHESFREFAAERLGDAFIKHCHQSLLDNWAQWPAPQGASAARHTYALRHGVSHALACSDWPRLRTALTSIEYMQAKCAEAGVFALENELQRAGEREHGDYQKLHRAVREESHWLRRDKADFFSILYNRLLFFGIPKGEILQILNRANPWKGWILKHPVRLGGAEIRTLQGHSDWINSCAISPDGRLALSASSDYTLKVWDLNSGQENHTLQGHSDWVNSCAISTDGRLALSASSDHTLKVWNIQSGEEIRSLLGHSDWVNSCTISPDGLLALSASDDNTLKVWDLNTGAEIRSLQGHTDSVMGCAISPDGRLALSASSDHTLKVWDIQSGEEIRSLLGHADTVFNCAISSDGRLAISASSDHTLKVWNLKTGVEIRSLLGHTNYVMGCTISPDGRQALSASYDAMLKVWDLHSGMEIHSFQGHTNYVTGCAISPNGRLALSASWDNTLKVWDLHSDSKNKSLNGGHADTVWDCTISPDGHLVLSASEDHTLKVWNLQSGAEIRSLQGHSSNVTSCAISPDGRLALSASNDNTLKIWDLNRGSEVHSLQGHTNLVMCCAISPDGRLVLSASYDKTLKIWDMQKGAEIHSFQGHTDYVMGCAISSDGRLLLSASCDHTLKVWNLHSGQEIRSLQGHTNWVNECAISPDGYLALSASSDQTLKVWDMKTGAEIRTLQGHSLGVKGCAISPDGRLALSASYDKTLKVWDLEIGVCLQTICGCNSFLCTAFDPKGQYICAGDAAGNVWILEAFKEDGIVVKEKPGAVRVFVSYAHEDEESLGGLRKILKILKEEEAIIPWMDKEILPGEKWDQEIKENLEKAQLILMVVSLNFRASDYCSKIETPRALEKLQEDSARVIPIILTECGWENSPLKDLQALPHKGKPVKKWEDIDEAWADVEKRLREVLKEMQGG